MINKNQKVPMGVVALVICVVFLVFGFVSIKFLGGGNSTPSQTSTAPDQNSGASAQKELTEFMELSKKAGLITSYDLSREKRIIYVGKDWYPRTVLFKKDFLAKVAMLQEKIIHSHFFEMRDSSSNEKVAEVTAFSGSLEVYK